MSSKITGPNSPQVQAFIGRKFNRLTCVRFLGMQRSGQFWEFKCDCGGTKNALLRNVIKGMTGSCGCLHREMLVRRNTIHGFGPRKHRHPIYNCWKAMWTRCKNPNTKNWKYYGGNKIPIKVCHRWVKFVNFRDDMLPSWKPGLTIERVNGKKGYCPSNCVWGDRFVQNRNKRNSVMITYNGETLNASVWAERIGGNRDIIYIRMKRGWSPERAVSTPVLWDHKDYKKST